MSKGYSGLFDGIVVVETRIIPGKDGVVTGGKSLTLGKNMLAEMNVSKETKWSGYQAQHIIPSDIKNHPVIQKIGMDPDDASNGIFLRVPSKDISVKSRHRGYHSVYSQFVRQELDKIGTEGSYVSIQRKVLRLQHNLKKLQEKGLPLYSSEGATIELWNKQMEKLK